MTKLAGVLTVWLPVLTAVAGGIWGLWLYLDHKREKNREDAIAAEGQARTRRIESRKPFLELQLRLYVETLQVIGALIAEDIGCSLYGKAEKRFWSLYWSELPMVESGFVEELMEKVGEAVKLCRSTGDDNLKNDLRSCSYKLGHQIRDEIETAWGGEPSLDHRRQLDAIKSLHA